MQVRYDNDPSNGGAPDGALRDSVQKMLASLTGAQREKVSEILSDPNKLKALLDSPAARAAMERAGKKERD